MNTVLMWAARIAGFVGIAATGVAVAGRVSGNHWLAGFQVGTVLQAGMAAMLVACLGYLVALTEQRTGR
jgi:hypothetical protein